jgi:DNA ligase (NAD+)
MPPGITCPDLLEVRGEIYISRADFQAINEARKNEGEEPFANPRNAASGSLKLLDPAQSSRRGLRFFAHSFGRVEGGPVLTSQSAFLEVARAYGFAVEPHTVCCRDIDEVISACKACEALRPSLPYEVDGVVLKVNDFNAQRQLGETMKSPRWAVAFKFQATQATTRVQDIVVSVGRTGVLTPVAELDPVACGGVMISRATLHNFDEVRRLGIAKGDRVLIERAGDVIPKIIKVVELAAARASVPKVPVDCPACREDFICEEEGAVAYRCINPACPRQLERRLVHFSSRKAMDIEGMGEAVVRQLLEKGLVKSLADVYALRKEDLLVLEFFGDKKADKLLTAIHQSKTRPLSRLMFGLGILNIGEKASLSLAKKFERMEALTAADKTALMGVQDIGEVSASALERFFCQPETRTLIAALAHAGVNMEEPRSSGGALRLSGKVFIFTGHLEKYSREDAETQVRALGAEAGSSVTRSTDFLVAGEAAGSKLDKARKLGVKVINEQQFEELLHDEG